MYNVAVILAGGIGARVGGNTPKQLLPLADGRSVLEHAVSAFEQSSHIDEVCIVMHPDYIAYAEQMLLANAWQKVRHIIPGGKDYALCLPIEISGAYIDQQDSILAYQAKELIHNRRAEIDLLQRTSVNGAYSVNGVTYYKIKEGDTLGGIAAKFRVSVKQLKAWNGLTSDFIRAGKTCLLYTSDAADEG